MNNILRQIAVDLKINSLPDESEKSYTARIIYSAMALHIKAATLDVSLYDEPNDDGASIIHIKKRAVEVLTEFLHFSPECCDIFDDPSKAVGIIIDRLFAADEIIQIKEKYYHIGNEGTYRVNDDTDYYRGIPGNFIKCYSSGLALLQKPINGKNSQSLDRAFCFESSSAVEYWSNYISKVQWHSGTLPEGMEYFDPHEKGNTLYTCFKSCENVPVGISLAQSPSFNNSYFYYVVNNSGGEIFTHEIEDYFRLSREHFRFRYALRKLANNPVIAEYILIGDMVVLYLYPRLPYAEMSILELISWPIDDIYQPRTFMFHTSFKESVFHILTNLDIETLEKENAKLQY